MPRGQRKNNLLSDTDRFQKIFNFVSKNFTDMNTETLSTDYNVAEGYFKILNPLNNGVKLYLLKMITDSLVTEKAEKVEVKKSTLFDLFGAWKDSPEMDGIEDVIRNSRTNAKTREIVSFD